jgi:hypothetical protein
MITSDDLGEVKINFRLDNDSILLNATIFFLRGTDGKLRGKISKLIKFDTVDEYLDSINKARNHNDYWTKLK